MMIGGTNAREGFSVFINWFSNRGIGGGIDYKKYDM
jgi:hypothetical protein